MCDHATLSEWTTKSSMAHAVAATPEGPFYFAPGLDKQLVVGPWTHGTYIIRDPPTGQYLLWWVGRGWPGLCVGRAVGGCRGAVIV